MLINRHPDSYITQEGVELGSIFGLPIYTDSADENNIYIGYCKINEDLEKEEICLICKIVINGGVTEKHFAYGKWIDRETLQYK